MKQENNPRSYLLFIDGVLLLGIVFSGTVLFCSSKQFSFALFNLTLFVILLVSVHILVRKTAELTIYKKKYVDGLTGFMTRHAFKQVFDYAILDARRSLEPFTILLVDIDHFRALNIEFGHETADDLLLMLSQSIQSVLRASDLTCRWEGDRILIALRDCTERDGCRLAKKILQKIRQQKHTLQTGQHVTISTSIGVAQMVSGDEKQTLVARAETGLHSAKDNGRDTSAIGYEWILIDYAWDPIF